MWKGCAVEYLQFDGPAPGDVQKRGPGHSDCPVECPEFSRIDPFAKTPAFAVLSGARQRPVPQQGKPPGRSLPECLDANKMRRFTGACHNLRNQVGTLAGPGKQCPGYRFRLAQGHPVKRDCRPSVPGCANTNIRALAALSKTQAQSLVPAHLPHQSAAPVRGDHGDPRRRGRARPVRPIGCARDTRRRCTEHKKRAEKLHAEK